MEQQPSEASNTEPRKRWWRRLRETDAGQTLVEFSLILPIMLIMLFALVDFGRGFYTWLVITNAAREGARAGATQADGAAIDAKVYDAFCEPYPSNCSLDPAKLGIVKSNVQGDRGTPVKVDLSYDFDYVTPVGDLLSLIGAGTLSEPTITAHAEMRLE